jgi:hypothetical protein
MFEDAKRTMKSIYDKDRSRAKWIEHVLEQKH